MLRSSFRAFAIAASLVLLLQTRAAAQADINNGRIRLGINPDGCLIINAINTPINSAGGGSLLGIRYMPTNNDGSAAGVPVDGWGVGDAISNRWGGAIRGSQTSLTAISQTQTANSAVCTVTAAGILEVKHDFHPSTDLNIYEIVVTIKNVSTSPTDVRYRRTIDWDIEPTTFNEYVTIQGATLPGVLNFTRDGFSTQNPLLPPVGTNGDVVNFGPNDLGATITISLGTLAPGASISFTNFYGAAADRAAAVASITATGVGGYTLASPSTSPGTVGTPNTFMFGFYGGSIPAPTSGVNITETGGTTDITEGGATDTYAVVLSSAPSANVTVNINPGTQATVLPNSLTFTPANWNVAQTVTVTAVDDAVVEGLHNAPIAHTTISTDTTYNNLTVSSVTARITDNDFPTGVTITQSGGSTVVTEGGATDTYTAVLNSIPTGNVTININPGTQVTVSPTTLTFTPANWNVPQTVTVKAVDDAVIEGVHFGPISHTSVSTDPIYNAIVIAGVNTLINDNDRPPDPSILEGNYPSSNGVSVGGGGEGTFGFGFMGGGIPAYRSLAPILTHPATEAASPTSFRVCNVSHLGGASTLQAETDSSTGPGAVGWSLLLTLAAGVGIAIRLHARP